MEKRGFVLHLKPGFEAEYERRHDEIWPELVAELKAAGISDYAIFLHPSTLQLFGVFSCPEKNTIDELPNKPIMKKWWAYMADIMDSNVDNSPVNIPLKQVFYMA